MRRHNRRRQYRQHKSKYITPVRATQARDQWDTPIPGQWTREDLPEALFAPGVSSEDGMLSEAVEHRAQIFFHEYVPVESTDRIEIPDHGSWQVVGHPNHWPMGTVLTLGRAS